MHKTGVSPATEVTINLVIFGISTIGATSHHQWFYLVKYNFLLVFHNDLRSRWKLEPLLSYKLLKVSRIIILNMKNVIGSSSSSSSSSSSIGYLQNHFHYSHTHQLHRTCPLIYWGLRSTWFALPNAIIHWTSSILYPRNYSWPKAHLYLHLVFQNQHPQTKKQSVGLTCI